MKISFIHMQYGFIYVWIKLIFIWKSALGLTVKQAKGNLETGWNDQVQSQLHIPFIIDVCVTDRGHEDLKIKQE